MRNIFLKKSYTKYDGETIPRPFSRKSRLSISLDQLHTICFNCTPSRGLSKYIETNRQTT